MNADRMGSDRSEATQRGAYVTEGAGTQPQGREPGMGTQDHGNGEVIGLARGQIMQQLEGQKSRLASSLNVVSDALDESGQRFREQNYSGMADYPGAAADQIRRFAEQLETSNLDEIVEQAEHVARERPALFLGGAFALGMIGARFLRSSPPRGGRIGSMGSTRMSSRSYDYGDRGRVGMGGSSSRSGTAGTSSTQGLRSTEALR